MKFSNFFVISLSLMVLLSCGGANSKADPNSGGNDPAVNTGSGGQGTAKIYSVDFERHEVGSTYNRTLLYQDWGSTLKSVNGIDEGRVKIIADGTSKVIRVSYPMGSCGPTDQAGCEGGGPQWLIPLDLQDSYNELFLSYRLKFSDNFNFVLGGKIPGLTGAPAPLDMPPVGGNSASECGGFSARMMWRAGGAAVTYLYYPDQPGAYGVDFPWIYPNGSAVRFIPGQWHTVSHRIVMNTAGKSDGIIEGWFDGTKVLHKEGLKLRGTTCGNLGINQFYFSTFFGGSDSSWAAQKDDYIFFDDFVISRP